MRSLIRRRITAARVQNVRELISLIISRRQGRATRRKPGYSEGMYKKAIPYAGLMSLPLIVNGALYGTPCEIRPGLCVETPPHQSHREGTAPPSSDTAPSSGFNDVTVSLTGSTATFTAGNVSASGGDDGPKGNMSGTASMVFSAKGNLTAAA